MVKTNYIPERGDLVWFDFNPQAGHEQAGKRPALVLTPREYHRHSGLALLCPITRQFKSYKFQLLLPPLTGVEGAVLVDHVRSMDFLARRMSFIAHSPTAFVVQVQKLLIALLLQN